MNITFLGTGTSVGIPAIGCDCDVCRSDDPLNRRRRTSLHVEAGGMSLLIDTTPDLREQALAHNVSRVDAVLFTHSHADHIFGLDDIRRYNAMQGGVIPAYASRPVIADLKRVFDYISTEATPGVYRPLIEFRELGEGCVLGDVQVQAYEVEHGTKMTHGFVVEHAGRRVGYFPDCHSMQDEVVNVLGGIDVMILDALRHRPHSTHLTLDECLAYLARIGAKRSYLIHLCHDLEHHATQALLPEGVFVSYDGLRIAL